MRLAVPALGAWLTALVLLGGVPAVAYGAAVVFVLGAVPMLVWGRTGAWAVAGALLVCAAASAAGVGLRLAAVTGGPVRALALDEAQTSAEAVVTTDPERGKSTGREILLIRARMVSVRVRDRIVGVRVPVLLLANGPGWKAVLPGERVRFTARLAPPDHTELLAAVALVRGPPELIGRPSGMQRVAATVRARLRAATDGLPADQRGVLPGMVVGDTSRLDPELEEIFKTAGLSHVLVVSGANLALVIGAVLAVCRLTGVRRRWIPVPAVLAVLAFVIVARPEPSVLRAAVMGVIGLIALGMGRERQGVPALSAAVLVLVLVDPGLARSYGFALSVLATAGLLILAPPWRDRLRRHMPAPLADAIAVSAAAQLACTPVLVMLSGQIGVVAVLANLLAAPAIPPATLLGALAAVVAPFALPLARLIVWPAGLAAGWIIGVARVSAALPYATLSWHDGMSGAVTLLIVGAVGVPLVRLRPLRAVVAAVALGVVAVVIVMRLALPGWPPRGWLLVSCDVGQGDALALAAGPGSAVVVDAGPEPALVDACLDRLGVRSVPLLVITHPHADHMDGIPGVQRGRTVGTLVNSPLCCASNLRQDGTPAPWLAAAIPIHPAAPGQQWSIGDLALSVLAPAPGGPLVSSRDDGTTVNNASVVLVARWPGLTALLAGDVEIEAQSALATTVPKVDVLKVPHHGSSRQDPAFITATHAAISITSVGEDNDYGHPAPTTLALLQRLGMHIYRTDQDGDIAVLRGAAHPSTSTRR